MIHYREQKLLPFPQEFLFNLVADIKQYPQFLPWCVGARIKSRTDDLIRAELAIRFGLLKACYTSRVHLVPHRSIDVIVEEGPLKVLSTYWKFTCIDQHSTSVEFDLMLELSSRLLQRSIEKIFQKAADEMMMAFENRAHKLYDPK